MRKTQNIPLSIQIASALLLSSPLAFPLATPAYASDPATVQQARELCIEQAKSKGFELKEVTYAGGADVPGKDAKIVLSLLREGQVFKLTCYYDRASGQVAWGEETAAEMAEAAAEMAQTVKGIPGWTLLLGLLLPLVGLGLLLAWARGRGIPGRTDGQHYEADIRSSSMEPIGVRATPSHTADLIGTVQNGQRVTITDRDLVAETGDWIELARGGWVPRQYVGTPSRA